MTDAKANDAKPKSEAKNDGKAGGDKKARGPPPPPPKVTGTKLKGKCKWFDSKKGYGYITPSDGSPEIFVHQTAIYAEGFRSLRDGEDVEYTVENDDKSRAKAANVTGPNNSFVQGAQRRPYRYRRGGGKGEDGAPAAGGNAGNAGGSDRGSGERGRGRGRGRGGRGGPRGGGRGRGGAGAGAGAAAGAGSA